MDQQTTPPNPPRGLDLLRAWLRGRSRLLLASLIAAGTAGIAVVAFGGYTVYDYTMNNPAFCRSCHTMEVAWTRWASSEHRKVDCHACHEQSIAESARQVVTFAVRRPERVGKHADVPAEQCQTCHTSGDAQWRQVAATAGHDVHAQTRRIECVTCHSTAVHRLRPATAVCAGCHEAQAVGARAIKIPQMADFHCIDCHEFLRPNSPLRPTQETCLGCHQGLPVTQTVGWPEDRAHTSLACGTCHKPHEKVQPIVTCTSCHTAPNPAVHPKEILAAASRSYTTCTACHQPHVWKVR
jgi:hypothetical protein